MGPTDAGTETISAYIDALICEHPEGVPLNAKQIAVSKQACLMDATGF